MDHQGARIADVGEVTEQLHMCDEGLGRRRSTVNTEAEDRAGTLGGVDAGTLMRRMPRQAGEGDPGDPRVGLKPLGDPVRIGDVLPHALRQGLHALQEQEGIEG